MTVVAERYGVVIVIAVIVAGAAALAGLMLRRSRISRGMSSRGATRRTVAEVGIVVGTWPWLWMILTPTDGHRAVQVVPFVDLMDVLGSPPSIVVVQIVGNLLVFAAWGFFGPMRFPIGAVGVGVTAFVGSLAVEVAQYALDIGRVSSVDDVLLNVLGAMMFNAARSLFPLGRTTALSDAEAGRRGTP